MPKLTKQVIDSHGKKEKLYTLWDTEVKGFGCRVQPSGKKIYIYLYRTRNDPKLKYLTIGVHGSITIDTAREIVKGWSADVARGNDPKQSSNIEVEKKIEKEVTFEEFFQIFTEKHRNIESKQLNLKTEQWSINKWILPFFGKKKLSEISKKDILAFKDVMKKVPGAFNRCFNIVRAAFNKAEEWEFIPKTINPCNKITKYPEKKMERFLSNSELHTLESILNSEDILKIYNKGYGFSIYAINALKLIIYTGCRKNEVLSLKWEDVYLEENYFHLKDSKGGERIVPLNRISIDILSKTPKLLGNPYVFPSITTKSSFAVTKNHLSPSGLNRLWNTIRNAIDCKDVRIHDLRHSFASFAIKKGIDIFRVAKLLGHKDIKTTMRYAHISKEDMISASNVVGEIFGNGI
jgi:integrase